LQQADDKDLLQHWDKFVIADNEIRDKKKAKRKVRKRDRGKNAKRDQTSAQRQVSRYINTYLKEQENQLQNCLERFQLTGCIDESVSSDSNGDEDSDD
jgi:hypothetical protein